MNFLIRPEMDGADDEDDDDMDDVADVVVADVVGEGIRDTADPRALASPLGDLLLRDARGRGR